MTKVMKDNVLRKKNKNIIRVSRLRPTSLGINSYSSSLSTLNSQLSILSVHIASSLLDPHTALSVYSCLQSKVGMLLCTVRVGTPISAIVLP